MVRKVLLLFTSDDDELSTLADPVDPDRLCYLELRAVIMKYLKWESTEIRSPNGMEVMNIASVVKWLEENDKNKVLQLNVRQLSCEPGVVLLSDWNVCFPNKEVCDKDVHIRGHRVSGGSGIAENRFNAVMF
ncbi:hypothetical protein CFOL_v3_30604 [Cephalotus follicularis]|uniref:Uncharacterized protein n=1 Tax=Cephalotus follicularis TaxID=3775 RepID=A0A1Q3D4I2_CEPFO|nr:hypothetical protein CFOL_v3_30604 [Cephalotus follicularis]